MFEQSILIPDPAKKHWTFAASILVEVSAVSVLLLVPLIYNERLGLGWIQSITPHVQPPTPPRAQPVVREVQPASRTAKPWSRLIPVMTRLRSADDIMKDAPQDPGLPDCPTCAGWGNPNERRKPVRRSAG